MRYYDLKLIDPKTNQVSREWTSHPNGQYDPHALDIEFDLLVAPGHAPMGNSTITIYGVALQDLIQAQNFYGMEVQFRGGMQKGLPLANPKQAGLLLTGYVFQSFGNWEGTEQTLDLVVSPTTYTFQNPAPIVLNWPAGMGLSVALTQALNIAFPGVPIDVHVSQDFVQNFAETGYFATFDQLATWVEQLTRIRPKNAVYMVNWGGQISIYDTKYEPTPIQYAFTDFVGQPTWIEALTMQVKSIMRADIQIGSVVKLPQGLQDNPGVALVVASAYPSQIKYKSTFAGRFNVLAVRHIGKFRSADGASWVTLVNCTPNTNA